MKKNKAEQFVNKLLVLVEEKLYDQTYHCSNLGKAYEDLIDFLTGENNEKIQR